MKFVRYGPLGKEHPGIIDDTGNLRCLSRLIPDLNPQALAAVGLKRLLQLNPADYPLVAQNTEIRLGACVSSPGKLIGIGFNSRLHTLEMGFKEPRYPLFFNKASSSINGPFDPVIYPQNGRKVDWEAELAVVIGKTCKNVNESTALDYILGYSCCNDISDRYWQFEVHPDPQHTLGKSFDTFAPLGPYIVTPDEAGDVSRLHLQLWVNDQLRQDFYSDDYVFGPARVISYLSSLFTLHPGDVISLGTGPGNAKAWNNNYLKPGDEVKMAIERIGRQQQLILAE